MDDHYDLQGRQQRSQEQRRSIEFHYQFLQQTLQSWRYPRTLVIIFWLMYQEINWDQWRNEIFTEGLVDKVKANYETLTSEEYNVENVITQLVSTPSKELEEIVIWKVCNKWLSYIDQRTLLPRCRLDERLHWLLCLPLRPRRIWQFQRLLE